MDSIVVVADEDEVGSGALSDMGRNALGCGMLCLADDDDGDEVGTDGVDIMIDGERTITLTWVVQAQQQTRVPLITAFKSGKITIQY